MHARVLASVWSDYVFFACLLRVCFLGLRLAFYVLACFRMITPRVGIQNMIALRWKSDLQTRLSPECCQYNRSRIILRSEAMVHGHSADSKKDMLPVRFRERRLF